MALFCPSKTMLLSAALFGLAFAYPELSRPEEADVFLQERGVCYEDDTLLSFEYWRLDSEPYCSSLLGIEDVTSTLLPATSRTTTTTLSEVATTLGTTLTVAQVTVSVTTTSIAGHVGRREKAATITSTVGMQPQPYYAYNPVPSILSYADRHASIASSVYSACSCLHISPKTVSSQTTVQTTRTVSGVSDRTEAAATVTIGTITTTITETAWPHPDYPYPVANSSSCSANSSILVSSSLSVPSISLVTIYGSSAGTGLPYPTSTSYISPASNTTSPTRTSITTSPTTTSLATSLPPPLNTTLVLPSTTLSSLLPIGTSIDPRGCPTINNTIYTLPSGQQYQIQCYRAYGGPVSIGLDQPHLLDCLEECSTVNAGFSAIRCFGVTWLKYGNGVHCNLKAQSALFNYMNDYLAASGVLLTDVPAPVVGVFQNKIGGAGTGTGVEGAGDVGETTGAQTVKGQLSDNAPGTWRVGRVP
ncbi:MAG: hypothetical protein Q9201_004090 [Fulgogasparrea decipioides]